MTKYDIERIGNYSEIDYKNALSILMNFDPISFQDDYNAPIIESTNFDDSYQGQCVKQPKYHNCSFNGTKFDGINGISSKIIGCSFENSRFKDAGMAYSDLTASKFLSGTVLYNCGFTKCNFSEVMFSNSVAEASVFDDSYFDKATITDSVFLHCSFDNSVFVNTKFRNCDLVHCDFEFTSFNRTTFQNVILPFWGVIKAFGLLQEISHQKNSNIRIKYSDTSNEWNIQQLINYLDPLQSYLIKKEEYFALANINIFLGKQEKALYALLIGIDKALKDADFRGVRYLCKLASNNILFTRKNLQDLYNAIINNSYVSELSTHEYMIYSEQIREIKDLLIDNPFFSPQISITIITTISPKNYAQQASLVQLIEKEIHSTISNCHYYYTVRHNSPPSYEFLFNGDINAVYYLILSLSVLFFGFSKSVKAFRELLETRIKYFEDQYESAAIDQKIKGLYLDNEIKEEELKKLRFENLKKEEEFRKQEMNDTFIDTVDKVESVILNTYTPNTDKSAIREYTITPDNDENEQDNS